LKLIASLFGSSRRHPILAGSLLLGACATTSQPGPDPIRAGQAYVAMGSSFAAGPGIAPAAEPSPARCGRSAANYAHLVAARLGLKLTDVSCSGATTAHLLGPWNELPPQLDALTAETRLVTVTIGGNDVGYIGSLGAASCRSFASPPPGTPGGKCPDPPQVSAGDWTRLEANLRRIVAEARRRAPAARLVFVDYLSVLPAAGSCAKVPLISAQADASRATAHRVAQITARVAAETGAEVLKATELSQGHDACSADSWVNGFPLPGGPSFIPYHPNARGMAAIADALERRLRR
jgi:lysophospholipase L1-like esterase